MAYHIAGNFRGRKLARILQFCGYLQKFSPQNLEVWHLWCCKSKQSVKVFSAKIVFFTISQKFSPSKVSCYMVSFICELNPLCLEVIEIARKNWIFVGSVDWNLPYKLYYINRVPMQRISHIILKGVMCCSFEGMLGCYVYTLVTLSHSICYLHPPWSLVAKQKIATSHVHEQQMSGLQSTFVFYTIQSYPMFICLWLHAKMQF